MEFSDWINQKFIIWRGDRKGRSASIAEYAKVFGASQQLMSDWMKKGGKVPKHKKYIDAFIREYGDEVYEVLDILKPEDEDLLSSLSPDIAARLRSMIIEINSTLQRAGPISESEARSIELSIMEKYGVNLKETDTP